MAERSDQATVSLVVGAGFLGAHLLPLLSGTRVLLARRRPPQQPPQQEGAAWFACDVSAAASCGRLAAAIGDTPLEVYVLLPPSALGERAPGDALAPLLALLDTCHTRHVVLASSSGIWADSDIAVVNADTPVMRADTPRVERLLAIESAWRAAVGSLSVVRLAGLYGPGRVIGRRALEQGETLPGSGSDWLNLVHGDDAARALCAAMARGPAARPLLISDGMPVRRMEYYTHLADRLGVAHAAFDGRRARRGASSRRCDPSSSWRTLHLEPHFADYRGGLAAALGGPASTPE